MESDKAAFMGRITAGVTHEIKNVFAIIKESAGLLEDLMSLAQSESNSSQERYLRIISKIYDQVERGVDLAAKLNEFAHTPDYQSAPIEINSAISQVVTLSQRFARLKRAKLEAISGEAHTSIVSDPLAFLMLLFLSIELVMDSAGENALIRVESVAEAKAEIMISADRAAVAPSTGGPTTQTDSTLWREINRLAYALDMSPHFGGPPPWISLKYDGNNPPRS